MRDCVFRSDGHGHDDLFVRQGERQGHEAGRVQGGGEVDVAMVCFALLCAFPVHSRLEGVWERGIRGRVASLPIRLDMHNTPFDNTTQDNTSFTITCGSRIQRGEEYFCREICIFNPPPSSTWPYGSSISASPFPSAAPLSSHTGTSSSSACHLSPLVAS